MYITFKWSENIFCENLLILINIFSGYLYNYHYKNCIKYKRIIDSVDPANKVKKKLDELANKFQELKKLAIKYKDGKDKEINKLNEELDNFKKTVDENNNLYETMLDKTTESLEKILLNTKSISKVQ